MKIHKGDTVKIMTGKDSGKTGKVIQLLPQEDKIVVEGLNMLTKHMRPQRRNEKGQRLTFAAPLHSSNAQVVCPKCNTVTRVGWQVLVDGKRQRICRKCKAALTE